MIDVSNAVGKLDELTLGCGGHRRARVVHDGVPYLPGQVESLAVLLQPLHHTKTLTVVGEVGIVAAAKSGLTGVTEGRVAEIVPQGGGLGQILVEPQSAGHGTGDLSDLQGVGQTGAVVIPRRRQEHLGLVHQPTEGLTVNDAVAVTLVLVPHGTGLHGMLPSASRRRLGGHRRQQQIFPLVHPRLQATLHILSSVPPPQDGFFAFIYNIRESPAIYFYFLREFAKKMGIFSNFRGFWRQPSPTKRENTQIPALRDTFSQGGLDFCVLWW